MRRIFSQFRTLALFAPALLVAQISFNPQARQLTPPPSNTPPEQKCIVEGHVTNAQTGEPLKKAMIRLISASSSPKTSRTGGGQGYATSSEADGGFRFDNVEPGDYTLSADRTGYLPASYGAKGARTPGKILTLSPAQQLTNLNVPLTRQAVISGKILDEDGDPVPDVNVQVLSGHWMGGKLQYLPAGVSSTKDLGEFRISHLGPGKYYLFADEQRWIKGEPQASLASGKPDMRPVRTFYPDAVTRAAATPIEIRAGQDAPGMDIRRIN